MNKMTKKPEIMQRLGSPQIALAPRGALENQTELPRPLHARDKVVGRTLERSVRGLHWMLDSWNSRSPNATHS
jgi:hypothetical protein